MARNGRGAVKPEDGSLRPVGPGRLEVLQGTTVAVSETAVVHNGAPEIAAFGPPAAIRMPFPATAVLSRTDPWGTYAASSTMELTGTVTLDGQNDPNAVWVFKAGTALNTGSGT